MTIAIARRRAVHVSTDQLLAMLASRLRRQAMTWTISGAFHGALVLLSMMVVMAVSKHMPSLPQEAALVVPIERVMLEPIRETWRITQGVPTADVYYVPAKASDMEADDGEDVDRNFWAPVIAEVPAPAPGTIGFFGRQRTAKAKPSSVTAHGLYDNRTVDGRATAVAKYGGSAESEQAVNLGLEWLASTQNADGSWSEFSRFKHQTRSYRQLAVSGLATLAFLSAGHTEKHGYYKDNVSKALQYIMERQRKDGGVVAEMSQPDVRTVNGITLIRRDDSPLEPEGYSHAICGLALSEAHGMGSSKTGAAAQRAVDYSVFGHQRMDGGRYSGWRYKPKEVHPDTSVTGWFVLQLKSAKASGLRVPGQGWAGAINYMDSVTQSAGDDYDVVGGAAYQPPADVLGMREFVARPVMTAVALTANQFLGKARGDKTVLCAARQVAQMPRQFLREHNLYGIYYGTLGMFQFGGDLWPIWNEGFRDPLIARQATAGEYKGSWFGDIYGARTYATAMAVLSLEVYYRYLPMCQEVPVQSVHAQPLRPVNPRVERVVDPDGRVRKVITSEYR